MTKLKHSGQAEIIATWLIYALLCVWLAVAVSWWSYARFDYGYGLWYELLDIREHIDRYAPENPARRHFEALPPAAHREAFHRIRIAVHDGGEGLEDIRYRSPRGEVGLLDEAEIRHLRDVASLLDRAFIASLLLVPVWLLLARRVRRRPLPSRRQRTTGALLLVGVAVLPLLAFGPTRVFYQFHIWLFPRGNQWFFYWEDSLMSTLMKAPFLFGAIAGVIVVAAAVLTPLLYFGAQALAGGRARR